MKRAALIVATWDDSYVDEEFEWTEAEIIPEYKIAINTVCEKCHNDR